MPRLLVPTDGSEGSLHAVRFAAELARRHPDIEIRLVNVQTPLPSAVANVIATETLQEYRRDQAAGELAAAKAILDEAGVRYAEAIVVGRPAFEITAYAKTEGCDQIIMGTRGLSPLPGALMGSVATRVLHLAEVPVTFVKS